MATDLDAHMTSAGSFTPGSRLESIDDAQQRQLQRSLAKMNELPLRCCFQCAPHTDPFTRAARMRARRSAAQPNDTIDLHDARPTGAAC